MHMMVKIFTHFVPTRIKTVCYKENAVCLCSACRSYSPSAWKWLTVASERTSATAKQLFL